MKQGIGTLSLVPMRAEPSEQSEQVSQLLAGQLFQIVDDQPSWVQILLEADGYVAWVDRKMITPLTPEEYLVEKNAAHVSLTSVVGVLRFADGSTQLISMGAQLKMKGQAMYLHDQAVILDSGTLVESSPNFSSTASSTDLIACAYSLQNTPYLWGGKSPLGMDCSGFTQVLFALQGILLPRDASQQVLHGSLVAFEADSLPGDLAFFENTTGAITHVGLIVEGAKIIHCSGQVRVDPWDSQGIYNQGLQRYTHQLRVIQRLF